MCITACTNDQPPPAAPPTLQVPLAAGGGEKPATLVVGLTPYMSAGDMRREFEPLVEFLGRAVGLPVRLEIAQSYAEVSELISTHRVHVSMLSPFAYVRAKSMDPGLVLLATQIADGASTYIGYIVVRDQPGYDTVQDLKGKRFLFVDRASASGYLYPLAYLRGLGIEPERFFKSIAFAGNHNQVMDDILAGRADGGAVASTVYRMVRTENTEGKKLKLLAKTGRIPYDAYCASPHLDQALIEKLRAALLGLSTRSEEGRRVLSGLTSINGFVAVGDDHYDEVRRVARLVEAANTLPIKQ